MVDLEKEMVARERVASGPGGEGGLAEVRQVPPGTRCVGCSVDGCLAADVAPNLFGEYPRRGVRVRAAWCAAWGALAEGPVRRAALIVLMMSAGNVERSTASNILAVAVRVGALGRIRPGKLVDMELFRRDVTPVGVPAQEVSGA
jgi:hypothetical protein